jgi:hypothetical protein
MNLQVVFAPARLNGTGRFRFHGPTNLKDQLFVSPKAI